jgi:uncharacterized protein YcfJ
MQDSVLQPTRVTVIVRSLITLLTITICTNQVFAQEQTARGAGIGGAAGAIIGGIIGHQNNETVEGALIGGAVGAITGGVIGNNRDRQIRDAQTIQWQQQQIRQQQAYQQQQMQRAVSMQDVVSMSQSGISDSVIINQMQTGGVTHRIGVSEIIALHQQGVHEVVINSMQNAPLAGAVQRPVIVQSQPQVIVEPRPVVVERVRVVTPAPCPYDAYYYHPHYYHHR